jgi:hypothetical protein
MTIPSEPDQPAHNAAKQKAPAFRRGFSLESL